MIECLYAGLATINETVCTECGLKAMKLFYNSAKMPIKTLRSNFDRMIYWQSATHLPHCTNPYDCHKTGDLNESECN